MLKNIFPSIADKKVGNHPNKGISYSYESHTQEEKKPKNNHSSKVLVLIQLLLSGKKRTNQQFLGLYSI